MADVHSKETRSYNISRVFTYPNKIMIRHVYIAAMPNIKFNYRYRDAGNYKNFGSVVFANPNNYSLQEVNNIIRSKLIDGEWFYAREWQVPDLHTLPWDEDLDHGFHEFEGVEWTNAPSNQHWPFK